MYQQNSKKALLGAVAPCPPPPPPPLATLMMQKLRRSNLLLDLRQVIWHSHSDRKVNMRISSVYVASLLVWPGGGGGGQDPQMYQQKKQMDMNMRERAKRVSASETYIFSGHTICIHIYTINAVPFCYLWYWRYKRQHIKLYTDKTLTLIKKKKMYMRASGASEHRKFSHFHILKLLFSSIIFCWYIYFRYFVSENIFSGLQIHLHTVYIQSMQFSFYWYGDNVYMTVYRP